MHLLKAIYFGNLPYARPSVICKNRPPIHRQNTDCGWLTTEAKTYLWKVINQNQRDAYPVRIRTCGWRIYGQKKQTYGKPALLFHCPLIIHQHAVQELKWLKNMAKYSKNGIQHSFFQISGAYRKMAIIINPLLLLEAVHFSTIIWKYLENNKGTFLKNILDF